MGAERGLMSLTQFISTISIYCLFKTQQWTYVGVA